MDALFGREHLAAPLLDWTDEIGAASAVNEFCDKVIRSWGLSDRQQLPLVFTGEKGRALQQRLGGSFDEDLALLGGYAMVAGGVSVEYLVRYGSELVLKSHRVRRQFQRRLVENLQAGMEQLGLTATISHAPGRLFVSAADPRIETLLSRVYGIHSYSLIEHECEDDLEAIARLGERFLPSVRHKSFAVRCRRYGKQTFRSQDVAERLGGLLNQEPTSRVDLNRPEFTLHVEVPPW